jgi:hypothetical protein
MGKTAFSGPVYGAKSLLWSYGPFADTHSTGASTGLLNANAVRVVPPYEDWMITEVAAAVSTNSTTAGHGLYLKSEGGSTTGIVRADGQVSTATQTIASFTTAGSSVFTGSTTVAATAGEYEGKWVPAGSTLRLVSSGVSVMGTVSVNVMGFIRYVNSTRAV